MEAGQGELGPFLLHAVAAWNGVHAQTPFNKKPLAHLNAILQLLSQVAPAHHLQFAWRISIAQGIESHRHLGNGGLIVLGVSNRRRVDHLDLEHAMVHGCFCLRRTS